jgi:O-antigen/teichoic acid export membrane protein
MNRDRLTVELAAALGSRFARDTRALMIGTGVGQILNVAASPILARLYLPEHFGVLGLLVACYSVLTPLACWRYDQAIMLPAQPAGAARLLQLSLATNAVMVGLSAVVVAVAGRPVALLIGQPLLADWLWTLPLLLLLAGLYQTLRVWLGRARRFGSIALGRISRAGVGTAAQLGLGWLLGPGPLGLVGGYWLGPATEAVVLAVATWRSPGTRPRSEFRPRRLKVLALRHRKFPLFAVPANLSNYAAVEGPTVLLAVLYSPTEVGLYWLSYRLLALPTALAGEAVSTVFFQRMAAMRGRGVRGAALTTQVFVALLGVGVIPLAVVFVLAPSLFPFVFGPAWTQAAYYAQALVPAELMLFAAFPLTQAFFVYEKQEIGLLWNLAFLAVTIAAFGIGAATGGPLASVRWYSIGSACMYALVVALAFRWSGGEIREIPNYLFQGLSVRPTVAGHV